MIIPDARGYDKVGNPMYDHIHESGYAVRVPNGRQLRRFRQRQRRKFYKKHSTQ